MANKPKKVKKKDLGMAIVRTAKGTATDKSSALSMTVASVQIPKDTSMVVGVGYDAGEGNPTMTWGNRVRQPRVVQNALGVRCSLFVIFNNGATRTNDVVVEWDTTAPTAKAMFVTQIDEVRHRDYTATNSGSTTTPTSGALVSTTYAEQYLTGLFVSEGPSGDTAGTPVLGYTSGQRAGTTGGAAISNITIHETFKITTATEDTRSRKTGATARDWVVIATGLKPIYTVVTDLRVTVKEVVALSQTEADSIIEADLLSRFSDPYSVVVI